MMLPNTVENSLTPWFIRWEIFSLEEPTQDLLTSQQNTSDIKPLQY